MSAEGSGAPGRDRARWIVPVVVALIAAIATVVAAAVPGLFSRGDGPATANSPGATSHPSSAAGQATTGSPAPTVAPTRSQSGPRGKVARSGSWIVNGVSPYDLDPVDDLADLTVSADTLTAVGGASLARLNPGERVGLEQCEGLAADRWTGSVPGDEVRVGDTFCVRTSGGYVAAITITDLGRGGGGGQQLINVYFSYSVWYS